VKLRQLAEEEDAEMGRGRLLVHGIGRPWALKLLDRTHDLLPGADAGIVILP
jgi:hypothetical protein